MPGYADQVNAPTRSSRPGGSCASSGAARSVPDGSPKPSTSFNSARPHHTEKASLPLSGIPGRSSSSDELIAPFPDRLIIVGSLSGIIRGASGLPPGDERRLGHGRYVGTGKGQRFSRVVGAGTMRALSSADR
jgi:hypothetical protein